MQVPAMTVVYLSELRFPERAEYLDDYEVEYEVHLEHWAAVGDRFAPLLRKVHTNVTSRLLVVCGDPGSGKSLFCQRLERDHAKTKRALDDGSWQLDLTKNLWEILSVNDRSRAKEILETVTRDTVIHRVREEAGWLDRLLTWAKGDDHKVRVIIFDNFDHAPYLAELAMTPLAQYVALRNEQREAASFRTIAEHLVTHTRGDLRRTILVATANHADLMRRLLDEVAGKWPEMPFLVEVPPLEPKLKERVARVNLNRLNPVSYWQTLDRAHPEKLEQVHRALTESTGVGRVYEHVSVAGASSRPGPRGRPHRFTLVTLGASTAEVKSRIDKDWEKSAPETRCFHESIAVWRFHQGFARSLRASGEDARRCRLFDSEFEVCWVALNLDATRELVAASGAGDLGQRLFRLVLQAHEVDTAALQSMDEEVRSRDPDAAWAAAFQSPGRARSLQYEPSLAARASLEGHKYSVGHAGYAKVKPDVTVKDCNACALTEARDAEHLREALQRYGHVVEFTSFLREELAGIGAYLLEKATNYATMLEHV